MSWQVGLYATAVLIPLAAFAVEAIFIRQLKRLNAYIATAAIGFSCLLSVFGFLSYAWESNFFATAHAAHGSEAEPSAGALGEHASESESAHKRVVWSASYDWVLLGGPAIPARPGEAAPANLVVPLGIAIDSLSVIMFVMVTFIATLIHIYSMGYMHDDPRYPRFFTYLSLFCFSMLGLVASSNVFMIFIFWELVGVCSYLLIGFWYEEKVNCDAANKAFIVNRIGDVGMLMGLGLLWTSLGTFSFHDINTGLRATSGKFNDVVVGKAPGERVVQLIPDPATHEVARDEVTGKPRQIPYWMLTLAGLGIFAGCVGKSAQFPLHVWLPDAMAGPTPVSALIHAATMVAAGVYLVGRFFPVFTEDVLLYIAYTGGITLFIAATIAMVQTDYKKVLAYSTVSQLGFMMLGLGVGGWAAGLFHLVTHAFFKALLFLGAGSVYHSVHTYEMPALGGLLKRMPRTGYAMLVGTLAISGVPFFSGFYSKDAILAAALSRVHQSPDHFMLFVFPAVGAVLTAFYMFRMWFLVFAGEPRGFPSPTEAVVSHVRDEEHALDKEHGHGHGHGHGHDLNPAAHAHESEPIMTWPLLILAFCSIFSGWTLALGLPVGTPVLEQMLEYGQPYEGVIIRAEHHYMALGASLVIMLSGIGVALLYYAPKGFPYFVPTRMSAARTAERLGGVYKFLVHKWYFDELYWAVFVRPCMALTRLCHQIDKVLIDGLVDGSAAVTALLARLEGVFDMIAVDRLVNLTGKGVYAAGDWSRSIQTGRLRNYLMFLAVALVGLFAGVFVWIRL